MKVVAVDPGPHCGVAIRHEDGSKEVFMIHNDMAEVWSRIIAAKPDFIVVERYASGVRLSVDGSRTIEIVGSLESLAHVLGAKFEKRSPQQRYAFMDQAHAELKIGASKLRSHEVDAYAHLLSWEHFEGLKYAK